MALFDDCLGKTQKILRESSQNFAQAEFRPGARRIMKEVIAKNVGL